MRLHGVTHECVWDRWMCLYRFGTPQQIPSPTQQTSQALAAPSPTVTSNDITVFVPSKPKVVHSPVIHTVSTAPVIPLASPVTSGLCQPCSPLPPPSSPPRLLPASSPLNEFSPQLEEGVECVRVAKGGFAAVISLGR